MKDNKDDDFDWLWYTGPIRSKLSLFILSLFLISASKNDLKNQEKSTFSKITDEQRASILETIICDMDELTFEHIQTDRNWTLLLFIYIRQFSAE